MEVAVNQKASLFDAAVAMNAQFRKLGLNDSELMRAVTDSANPVIATPKKFSEIISERRERLLVLMMERPNQEYQLINLAVRLPREGKSSERLLTEVRNDLEHWVRTGKVEKVKISSRNVLYRLVKS